MCAFDFPPMLEYGKAYTHPYWFGTSYWIFFCSTAPTPVMSQVGVQQQSATRGEARRIAANIAKPESYWGELG